MDAHLKAILRTCLDSLHAEGFGDTNEADTIAGLLPTGTKGLYFTIEEDQPQFGEIELSPFQANEEGEYPEGTQRLDALPDGELFEDAEGRLFNIVSQGPTQGSTEITDADGTHAYYDCGVHVMRMSGTEIERVSSNG